MHLHILFIFIVILLRSDRANGLRGETACATWLGNRVVGLPNRQRASVYNTSESSAHLIVLFLL